MKWFRVVLDVFWNFTKRVWKKNEFFVKKKWSARRPPRHISIDFKFYMLVVKGQQKELLTWAHEVDINRNTDTISRQLSRCTLASIRNSCKTMRWWLEITSHRLRSQSINFKDRDLKFSMESIWFHHRNIGSFHQILIIMQVFMTLQTRCILTTNLSAVSSTYVSLDCVRS